MILEEVKNQYPDFVQEDLVKYIEECKYYIRNSTLNRIRSLNKTLSDSEAILNEWNKVQKKESYLTNSERKEIAVLVGMCLIDIIKK